MCGFAGTEESKCILGVGTSESVQRPYLKWSLTVERRHPSHLLAYQGMEKIKHERAMPLDVKRLVLMLRSS